MKKSNNYVFLCGGLTGGPIIPLLAISQNIDCQPVIFDAGNSFGQKVANQKNYDFVQLPVAKLGFLTFKEKNIFILIKGVFEFIVSIFRLFYGICKTIYNLYKFKPKAVISAGGFTAVPVCTATKFFNIFKSNKVKIIIHQQDPTPGLTNKITSNFADYLTCTFEYTKNKFKSFNQAKLIPNPIDYNKFDGEISRNDLVKFIQSNKKNTLLVFGGGSGSLSINNWIEKNIDELTKEFKLIHVTGIFREKKVSKTSDYYAIDFLDNNDMANLIKKSDLVLCRAGVGSITELMYLQKKAFLVPLPNSHQEKNAEVVNDYFEIFHEKDMKLWLDKIIKSKKEKNNKKIKDPEKIKKDLKKYYQEIKNLININL